MSSTKGLLVALCLLLLTGSARCQRIQPLQIQDQTFDQWMHDLSHLDPNVRAAAVAVMPRFRLRGEDAVRKLAYITTHDRDERVRKNAILALQVMGIRAGDLATVVHALGHCVSHDPKPELRLQAARTLGRFHADVQQVAGDLTQGMGDRSSGELRLACINALIAAGVDPQKGPDPRVTDALLRRLDADNEKETRVQSQAALALGVLGQFYDAKKLRQIIDGLKAPRVFESSDKAVRIWSRVSLMALEDKDNDKYLKCIAEHLSDADAGIRLQAVLALGGIGERASRYAPTLARLLPRETEPDILVAACQALARLESQSEEVLKSLIRLTRPEEAKPALVVLSACHALMRIGKYNTALQDALYQVLRRPDLDDQSKDVFRRAIEEARKPHKGGKANPNGEITGKRGSR